MPTQASATVADIVFSAEKKEAGGDLCGQNPAEVTALAVRVLVSVEESAEEHLLA